jgi:hypothetical protein
MFRSLLAVVLASAFIVGGATQQPAAADPPPGDLEPWRVNLALYGWAMSVSGNATVHNQTLDTNASFLDLVQKSDSVLGFMGYAEANKGRVGVYTDLVFTSWDSAPARPAIAIPWPGCRSPRPPAPR